MSHLLVYATTESRLHADLVVVRLKQTGIPTAHVSILHAPNLRPNSALCWIAGTADLRLSSGQDVVVSGPLSRALNEDRQSRGSSSFGERMKSLGLNREQSSSLENSLLEDRIVIAVEVHDEYDMPAIYHTLRGLSVEKVRTADVAPRRQTPARSHVYHPEFAPVAFGSACGSAA